MADILLVTINAKWIHPSLALRFLKANLGEFRDRCDIAEFALRQPLEEKTGPILAAGSRILGISVSIWNHTATLDLLRALEEAWAEEQAAGRAAASRPIIVLGGPEASWLPADAELFRHADYVVRGEGELAFRELCETILVTPEKAGGKFIDARPPELSGLASPYGYYSGEDLCRKLIYVEASRGCPFRCEFCLSSVEGDVRNFPLDPFLAEMDGLIAKGGRTFKFLDRTFNLDMGRTRRIIEFFLDRIERCSGSGRQFWVHFEMVPSRFPVELRETLRRFPPGSLRLELGIQTLNPETAVLIGRPLDAEQDLEILDFLHRETNAIVHADLIAGLPGEDMASFGRGFDRLWQVRPGEIQVGILKCLPGTPINRHTEPCGMRYAALPPYEILETACIPQIQMDRIKNFARFWELIMNRHTFDKFSCGLFPPGVPVFEPFLVLSDWLLARFGRNWGIDAGELRAALEEFSW
jgi:hypothetical protein